MRRVAGPWLALVGLLLLGALVGFVREYSSDFHWHVVLGERMLAQGAIYRVDDRSWTFAGHPMFVSCWLGDVLLALAFRAGSYVGCYLLRAACLVGTLALLAREMERRGLSRIGAVALLTLLVAQGCFNFYLRPELFAFLALAALHHLLGEHERTGRLGALAASVGLLALWPNLHGSSGIGLMVLGVYCAERLVRVFVARPPRGPIDRRALAVACATPVVGLVATFANPEGPGAILAFRVVSPFYVTHTAEWLPQRWGDMPLLLQAAVATVIGTSAIAVALRRVSPWRLAQALVLGALAFKYHRFTLYALIGAAPLLAGNLAALRDALARGHTATAWRRLGAAAAGLAAAWGLTILVAERHLTREIGTGVDPAAYPIAACRFAREHRPPGHLLNDYDLGSWLMFCLDEPVFIDQREWSLYPEPFFQRLWEASLRPDRLRALVDDYDIGWAFVGHGPHAAQLGGDPRFRLVWLDDGALIYERREHAAAPDRPELGWLDPTRLGALPALDGGPLVEAKAELALQLARSPDGRRTQLARAAVAIAADDEGAYRDALVRLLAAGPSTETAFLAGQHAMKHGEWAHAAELFASIPALGGDPRFAAELEAAAREHLRAPR